MIYEILANAKKLCLPDAMESDEGATLSSRFRREGSPIIRL